MSMKLSREKEHLVLKFSITLKKKIKNKPKKSEQAKEIV